jgi:hypothetical protein
MGSAWSSLRPAPMAHSAAEAITIDQGPGMQDGRIRIGAECLELNPSTPEELDVLRAWVRRVNGPTYAQPFLVEGPPGHFRLYVGEAAERVRTAQGIQ